MDTLELLAARAVVSDENHNRWFYRNKTIADISFGKYVAYFQGIEDMGGRFYEGGL